MPKESPPSISREFCQQVRQDGGLMALTHLSGMLRKEGRCPDCPNTDVEECKNHIQDLIGKILPSSVKDL